MVWAWVVFIVVCQTTCWVLGYRCGYKEGGDHCEAFYHSVLRGYTKFRFSEDEPYIKIPQS
jgi:hypothetical protein